MQKKLTETGAKARQRDDTEDRSLPYRDWHRTLSSRCVATDVDMIEWRQVGGKLMPRAVIELTRMDPDLSGEPLREYLSAVLARMLQRDSQAHLTGAIAGSLANGLAVYVVVFTANLQHFHVYNLTRREGWAHFTEPQWRKILEEL